MKISNCFSQKIIYLQGIDLIMEWDECMQTAQNGRIDSGQIKELRGKWRAKADALIPALPA